jgi:putative aminopeptidase FrvX
MKADVNKVTKSTITFLKELLAIQSPTNCCDDAIEFLKKTFSKESFPDYKITSLAGGALLVSIKGNGSKKRAPVALTAHVDTLGLCVRSIKANGRLTLSNIGGQAAYTVEGEYCTLLTLDGKKYRGTVVHQNLSAHAHKTPGELQHTFDHIELRLDEKVSSEEDVRKLGIDAGDLVLADTRTEITDSGFIKARYLDDKAGVAAIFGMCKLLQSRKQTPPKDIHMLFAIREEVGGGAATGIPSDVEELVVVDMGVAATNQYCDEYSCSICMKDGSGPYDRKLTAKLVSLAEKNKIAIRRDIYPFYGSDRQSFLMSGGDARVALIGPGIDGSHAYERTHFDAISNTIALLAQWAVS